MKLVINRPILYLFDKFIANYLNNSKINRYKKYTVTKTINYFYF
jgi:hypothetical protein